MCATLDNKICYNDCSIGKAACDAFLVKNNSVINAASDFNYFVENCFKTCPYKQLHLNLKQDLVNND